MGTLIKAFSESSEGNHGHREMKRHQGEPPNTILAAGGILRGEGANEGMIAIVCRRRYGGEIGLPKGKVKAKEDLLVASVREVKEETGYDAEITGYAGATHYHVEGRPKAVFYFIMRVLDSSSRGPFDDKEIERMEWMTPHDAAIALTHIEDRNLIATVFALPRK